jgi:hypothetical protein
MSSDAHKEPDAQRLTNMAQLTIHDVTDCNGEVFVRLGKGGRVDARATRRVPAPAPVATAGRNRGKS